MKPVFVASCAVVTLGLTGCQAIGPDYAPPELETNQTWASDGERPFNAADPEDIERWWESLNDPVLNDLISRAFESNLDLASAVQSVRQAAAIRGISAGERFPDLDANGSYSRERFGQNGFPSLQEPATYDSFALGLEFGWELDIWGRVRRLVESADADLAASIEDLHDVRVLLASEVASDYISLRTAQARLAVARQNIEIQQQSLVLTTTRFENGAAPQLDVAQAQTNLANTEAEVPSLEADVRDSTLSLAVLLGLDPTALLDELASDRPIPLPPTDITVGVPSDVLRRRPDVRSAERRLAAEVARIGVELGDLYPRFTLGGSLEFNSTNSASLFDADSANFGFGPSFSWNIFDGGRVRGELRAQEAVADLALLTYKSSVLNALEEVESAMYRHARQLDRTQAFARASVAAEQSAELSRQLYLEGRSNFQNVLDSERELFSAQDNLILAESDVALTFVILQRSLGGGWSPTTEETEEAEATDDPR